MYTIENHPVPADISANAHINKEKYARWYQQSIDTPDQFWAERALELITWYQPWQQVRYFDFSRAEARWFEGATLNACYNCVDRHLETRGDQVAIIWEGDAGEDKKITYRQLHQQVCKLANVLKNRGVKKGDRVCIYMPMIPEAAYAMLACARIGAIHSVVFGGFSPEALKDRILNADCRVLITADEGRRGGKTVPLKANVDEALRLCPDVHSVITVRCTGAQVSWHEGRDCWYHDVISQADVDCQPEIMSAEDPLFILYTSGSTGKPKGVLHTTGGYLVQAALTHKYVFDYHEGWHKIVHGYS